MNVIVVGLLMMAVAYIVGLLCYWQGQRDGYADGFADGQRNNSRKDGWLGDVLLGDLPED